VCGTRRGFPPDVDYGWVDSRHLQRLQFRFDRPLLLAQFRHAAAELFKRSFNKTYGTLGAAIALMTWLYWTGFALLVGAELNCELAKIGAQGKIEEKHEPSPITRIDFAA
jgi:Virulence factor BrkB